MSSTWVNKDVEVQGFTPQCYPIRLNTGCFECDPRHIIELQKGDVFKLIELLLCELKKEGNEAIKNRDNFWKPIIRSRQVIESDECYRPCAMCGNPIEFELLINWHKNDKGLPFCRSCFRDLYDKIMCHYNSNKMKHSEWKKKDEELKKCQT